MNPATYRFKTAAFDIAKLKALVPDAELGDAAGTIHFRSPSGHTVKTPYDAAQIAHHQTRDGNEDAYYQNLARRLQEHGAKVDRKVERQRDEAVARERGGNMVGGATLGGLAGGLLGAVAGGQRHGGPAALIGGGLGMLGGGYLGHGMHVDRKSGPTSRDVREIPGLYTEPAQVKQMRQRLNRIQDNVDYMRVGQDVDRMNRWMDEPYRYDWRSRNHRPYYGPYYNR